MYVRKKVSMCVLQKMEVIQEASLEQNNYRFHLTFKVIYVKFYT